MVPVFAGIILSQASTPDNDRLSPEVRNFVNKSKDKEKISKEKRKVVLKSDLLGQKNKNINQDTTVFYVGSLSIGVRKQTKYNRQYSDFDSRMDNYIYNTLVTEIVNAGNYTNNNEQTEPSIQDPGKALNAITVGAVSPLMANNSYGIRGFKYESYSKCINSNIGNSKPEVLNVSGIDIPMGSPYNFIGRTSASTPLTAALVANLMSQHPFYKGHPEMAKAVLLTSNWGNICTAIQE